jgi:hypothetical protein
MGKGKGIIKTFELRIFNLKNLYSLVNLIKSLKYYFFSHFRANRYHSIHQPTVAVLPTEIYPSKPTIRSKSNPMFRFHQKNRDCQIRPVPVLLILLQCFRAIRPTASTCTSRGRRPQPSSDPAERARCIRQQLLPGRHIWRKLSR